MIGIAIEGIVLWLYAGSLYGSRRDSTTGVLSPDTKIASTGDDQEKSERGK